MANEPLLKMQTAATSAMLAFCSGLTQDEDDEDDQENVNGAEIMQMYSTETLQALAGLLEKGITQNYEPLQMQSLSLIGTISEVIGADFSQFFMTFMGAFSRIIENPD